MAHVTTETTAELARAYRPVRAWATLLTGAMLGAFALIHTVWTGFHAPLAAWIAPLSVGLIWAGLWSLMSRRALPRWAAVILAVLTLTLAVLVAANVIYALTRQPHAG